MCKETGLLSPSSGLIALMMEAASTTEKDCKRLPEYTA
jgi:hypothetical protein